MTGLQNTPIGPSIGWRPGYDLIATDSAANTSISIQRVVDRGYKIAVEDLQSLSDRQIRVGRAVKMAASQATTTEVDVQKSSAPSLAELSALERLRFFARRDPFEFASLVAAIPGSLYLLGKAAFYFWPEFANALSLAALAQDSTPTPAPMLITGRDAFDWYIAALMGFVLLCAVLGTLFANNENKIKFGADMTKTIVGFAIGFLSGGAKALK